MPKHKPHLEVSQSELYSSNLSSQPFTLHRHDAFSLSTLLISNLKHRSTSLTCRQQAALSKLSTSHLLNTTKNHRYTRVEILRAYLILFDDLFFFGSLKLRCGLRFCFKKASERALSGVTTLPKKGQRVFQRLKGKG